MKEVVKEYSAKLDNKNRLTLRESKFYHYKVRVKKDGTIILKPQILVDLDSISENTYKMIKKSVENLKKGKASKPINLDEFDFDKE
ncbi:MAG TPA: hypothetical protein VFF33_01360 [Ignavibacteriaceae bacterium]|nr:hypothetical protein [Ignavibacteriaceae bacterium]